jgi:hypothetical protein
MVARQPLATVREARYGYAVANMGSNPYTRSQRIRRRTTMTIRSLVYPRLTTLMSLIPLLVRLISG